MLNANRVAMAVAMTGHDTLDKTAGLSQTSSDQGPERCWLLQLLPKCCSTANQN